MLLLTWSPSPVSKSQHVSGPTKIKPESLSGCSPKCQNGIGVYSEGQRSPLPQHGVILWQLAPQSFCNCGQGLLQYLNDFVNLGIYIAFTAGSSKPAQIAILTSFILLSSLPVTLPEQGIFLALPVTKYRYGEKQRQCLNGGVGRGSRGYYLQQGLANHGAIGQSRLTTCCYKQNGIGTQLCLFVHIPSMFAFAL